MADIRVRFAPSPTGYLHIGGARTALFNWLFARKNGGKFLLRIEDTDQARSGWEMVQAILEGLKWLGLHWDEEPIFQSSRIEIYNRYAQELIQKGRAYYCYCSPERLEEERKRAAKERRAFRYDGRCRNLTEAEKERLEREGVPKVVRFRVPEGVTSFDDHVHGRVEFQNSEIDDFVILRSDGFPTYHLAVVVDDKLMGITHVIRGDDHLSNTPKQILLYRAFGWDPPEFAHVPLILGPDKSRLSKRHGATAISEYAETGILPEAMVNYLALLGWSPGEDREIMSLEELIQRFDLKGISPRNAIFDERKLEWMNSQYINSLSDEELTERVLPFLRKAKLVDETYDRAYLIKVIGLLKSRMKRLTDFVQFGRYFFLDPEEFEQKGVEKYWRRDGVADHLRALSSELSELEEFNVKNIEEKTRGLADRLGVKAGDLIHPTRLALTGFTVGPGLFEVMEVLGKEVVLRRLGRAVEVLSGESSSGRTRGSGPRNRGSNPCSPAIEDKQL